MSKDYYTLTVEPLTGVHIGTGQELTPLDYLLKGTTGGKKIYIKYSSEKILDRLVKAKNEQAVAEFERISDSTDMKQMQTFFHKYCVVPDDMDYPCDVTDSFAALYDRNKNSDPLDVALQVCQMYRPAGAKQPVIPGSSLKGSIRTALLADAIIDFPQTAYDGFTDEIGKAAENRRNKLDRENAVIQQRALDYKDAQNDPFRCIGLSDCVFPVKDTQLVGRLYNITAAQQTGEFNTRNMQIAAEIIRGQLLDGKAGAQAELFIDTGLQKSAGKGGKQIRKTITAKDIVRCCNSFFGAAFEKEYDAFYKNATDRADVITELRQILKSVVQSDNTVFIVRVGRWSQVEYVTFEDNLRHPVTRNDKMGKPLPWGTTRTVFDYNNEYIPLGWCKCTLQKKQEDMK
jgi:CRISPR-associated protein Csm5